MSDFNPYTCRLFTRIDQVIWALRGRRTLWSGGRLCFKSEYGVLWQAGTHFPDWSYHLTCWIQNRWTWTRSILSI